MEIKERVAIVTGGTGELGHRICRALCKEGAHVVVVYHQSEEAAEKISEICVSPGSAPWRFRRMFPWKRM